MVGCLEDPAERGQAGGQHVGPGPLALTFADVALLDKPPEHVRAVVAIRRLVEGFLAEGVPVIGVGWRRGWRHVPRPTAGPLTPDFHRVRPITTGILTD